MTNSQNEVAHRMARNSQRQSKIAQKVHESQEATSERKLLELQLAEEIEARKKLAVRTKELSAQLKVAKKKSPALVASSSGRVKTIAPRTASSKSARVANAPVNMSEPEPPLLNSVGQDVSSSAVWALSGVVSEPEPPILNSLGLDESPSAVWKSPLLDLSSGVNNMYPDTMSYTNYYGSADGLLNPDSYMSYTPQYNGPDFRGSLPAYNPHNYSLDPSGLGAWFGCDSGLSANIPSAGDHFVSMSAQDPSPAPAASNKPRRSNLDGLEPKNILAPGASRSRAASSRKRDADDESSEQPAKKARARKIQLNICLYLLQTAPWVMCRLCIETRHICLAHVPALVGCAASDSDVPPTIMFNLRLKPDLATNRIYESAVEDACCWPRLQPEMNVPQQGIQGPAITALEWWEKVLNSGILEDSNRYDVGTLEQMWAIGFLLNVLTLTPGKKAKCGMRLKEVGNGSGGKGKAREGAAALSGEVVKWRCGPGVMAADGYGSSMGEGGGRWAWCGLWAVWMSAAERMSWMSRVAAWKEDRDGAVDERTQQLAWAPRRETTRGRAAAAYEGGGVDERAQGQYGFRGGRRCTHSDVVQWKIRAETGEVRGGGTSDKVLPGWDVARAREGGNKSSGMGGAAVLSGDGDELNGMGDDSRGGADSGGCGVGVDGHVWAAWKSVEERDRGVDERAQGAEQAPRCGEVVAVAVYSPYRASQGSEEDSWERGQGILDKPRLGEDGPTGVRVAQGSGEVASGVHTDRGTRVGPERLGTGGRGRWTRETRRPQERAWRGGDKGDTGGGGRVWRRHVYNVSEPRGRTTTCAKNASRLRVEGAFGMARRERKRVRAGRVELGGKLEAEDLAPLRV
ncbi:hypothetical protein DFH07DRAFT_771919 [Mycena maculata]|uniref:Uncharacterized protein n=1 Tax=Mycena maculata TaxID=230809 RepID=A0AAD7NHK8_9AGAR|nr:hypothetical protein DFH07DRAFT_771919 [Mycena maculata]